MRIILLIYELDANLAVCTSAARYWVCFAREAGRRQVRAHARILTQKHIPNAYVIKMSRLLCYTAISFVMMVRSICTR